MNYLIFPDIHNKFHIVEKVIERYDKNNHTIIFLGDYFDSYGDKVSDAENTVKWLKYSLNQSNRIHLAGNHDYSYMYNYDLNPNFNCPGWCIEKHKVIRSILSQSEFLSLKLYHYIETNNFLLSHAGFSLANLFGIKFNRLIKKGGKFEYLNNFDRSQLLQHLDKENYKFLDAASNNQYHHFMYQGERMGDPGSGGPFWMDFDDFLPIVHFNQIFGHTHGNKVRKYYIPSKKNAISVNFCLDTGCNHYIVMREKGLEILKCKV